MDIERNTQKNPDGTVTVVSKVVYTVSERLRIRQMVAEIKDLSGVSQMGGSEVYDNTAMVMMTEHRKKTMVDAAELIEKILYGDDDV